MVHRTSVLLGAVFALALVAGSASASPRPGFSGWATRSASASSYCADSQEQAFLKLVNDYRKQNGLAALTLSQSLGAAADHHSQSMADYDYVSHDLIPEDITWSQNLKNYGYTYTTYRGENIAAGNSSASATFAQWKASSTHNANMLSAKYKAIGVGRASNSNSQFTWYWTTDFGGTVDAKGKLC
jgi:uncharacterized protein YkwD